MAQIHALLAPYKPSSDDPFDTVKAAHLLNRAGFGGTPQEIDRIIKMGPQAAADWLLDFPDAPAEEENTQDVPDLSKIDGLPKSFNEFQRSLAGKSEEERKQLRAKFLAGNAKALLATGSWWMKRMAYGPYPLQEKLTLFWHGHFTTSAKDERAANLMWRQNELLRQNAAGNFADFVRAVSKDPAMLDYLNNNQNRKQHPNENYAREVMELFTLGIGNYTEQDIKEAARAFTGWAHQGDEFVFNRNDHDDGMKTFFGQRGNFGGDEIISLILQHPACPRYISGKLFKMLAYDDIDQSLSDSLGEILLSNQYQMRPLLRTILTSKAFYSTQSIGSQIKSPVQLVIGTIRILNLEMPPEAAMASALNQMGQVPFFPPNVKGWPGGHLWISTSTLFVRYNTGVWLAGGAVPAMYRVGRKGDAGKPNQQIENHAAVQFDPKGTGTAEQVVNAWLDQLIQRPVANDQKQVLIDALGDNPDNEQSVRKMVQLIVSMPEYQLC